MFNPLPLLKAEIRRTLLGAIAIILLIAVATALGVAISSQERALRKGSTSAAHEFDIIIGSPGSPTQLVLSTIYLQLFPLNLIPGTILNDLQKEEGVEFASPIAFGDRFGSYPIIGTTEDFITLGGKRKIKEGRVFQSLYEAVAGSDVKLLLGGHFTPIHGYLPMLHEDEAEHTGVEYKIVGRMLPQGTPWDRAILVPVESVWDVHGLAMGHVHRHTQVGPPWSDEIPGVPAVVVKPKTIADAYRIRNLYNTDKTIAIFPADVLLKLYDILGNIRDVVAGISLATQIMVLIAILLTIFITINNRRKQIAVLRAMGATPAYIFCSIWLYTVFLIVTGAGLGLILGWLAAHILSLTFYARTGLELPVVITWQEVGLIASLVFFGMFVTIISAWLSYRMPVAETLKGHE